VTAAGSARGRELLDAADERIAGLAYGFDFPIREYGVTGRDVLADLLVSPRSTRELVALHRRSLQRASGRRTFWGIARWVDRVRPVLLADRRAA